MRESSLENLHDKHTTTDIQGSIMLIRQCDQIWRNFATLAQF